MAGVPECGICSHAYDERDRKPRVLQCGHTYCQPCLQGVVSQGSPACPSCRRDIVSPVAELPVNFIAIPASGSGGAASKNEAGKDLLCSSHRKELDFWCTECKIVMCKLCLVNTHNGHKLTVIEEAFADQKILTDTKSKIKKELQETKLSIEILGQSLLLASKIDKLKTSQVERRLSKKHSHLTKNLNMLENITPESPLMEKNTVLECLKYGSPTLHQIDVREALKQVGDWVAYCQAVNFSEESPVQPEESPVQPEEIPVQPEDYMPRGQTWEITTGAAADRALRTTRETDHTTPKAVVRSTDESPILCLFELLQYLAVASGAMELELMDSVEREWPREKEWFPLKTGGDKSTDFWHCYRLRALARAWRDLPAAAPASGARRGKVVAIVDCYTRTRDVGVLAVGKVARRGDGSWPLPLEVHLLDSNYSSLQWLECCLPPLYALAEPSLGECRVYVPGGGWLYDPGALFSLLAELGRKYSTQHRLYLNRTFQRRYDEAFRQLSAQHKVPCEWKDF